jgi:formate hydrogenlyase subunit 3/multisubunit Na+/H+ antiporter MnhD subunit
MISFFFYGLIVMLLGGVAAAFAGRNARTVCLLGAGACVAGSLMSTVPAIQTLAGGSSISISFVWHARAGSFFAEIDALSAFFLLPVLGLSAIASVYGAGYLQDHYKDRNLGACWFFYNLLVVGMCMVIVARSAVLFLMSWELMSIASFALVAFEYRKESVRHAAWIYLAATHIGTAFLMALFIVLSKTTGSTDFAAHTAIPAAAGNIMFVLALAGFGAKAGILPLHVWLPHAHPAAPSHVSAVMSGVMIKTGIYGLLRVMTIIGPPHAWWGWVLIAAGAASGIFGVLLALDQKDVKRLLAYCSVENIGVILLGLGAGTLGITLKNPSMAILGFSGCLLHVLNHAVYKGLLFMGAGAVIAGAGTGEMDRLGGLIKKMPLTAAAFLVGSAAIAGLPPLNGFISEFLIFSSVLTRSGGEFGILLSSIIVVGGLAIIGGLSLACFTKAFGSIFLGHPRSEGAASAHEAGTAMRLPMLLLAVTAFAMAFLAPLLVRSLPAVAAQLTNVSSATASAELDVMSVTLARIVAAFTVLTGLLALVAAARLFLLRGRSVRETVTWDCGYAKPSRTMQYTATSFTQPLAYLFGPLIRRWKTGGVENKVFPGRTKLEIGIDDIFEKYLWRPLFKSIAELASKFLWLQHGKVQIYVLYTALTLWVLLLWKLIIH